MGCICENITGEKTELNPERYQELGKKRNYIIIN